MPWISDCGGWGRGAFMIRRAEGDAKQPEEHAAERPLPVLVAGAVRDHQGRGDPHAVPFDERDLMVHRARAGAPPPLKNIFHPSRSSRPMPHRCDGVMWARRYRA